MGRITGTVYCADTRKPARGAMVMVIRVPPAGDENGSNQGDEGAGGGGFSRTSMDGSYTAEHIAPGEYNVVAMLPGYLSGVDGLIEETTSHSTDTKLRERLLKLGSVTVRGAGTEHFDISLERGGAVSGQVFYSDGSPATLVTIDVDDVKTAPNAEQEGPSNLALYRTMFTHQVHSTDDQGRFRIAVLKPGSYRVAAVSLQGAAGEGGGNLGEVLGTLADQAALHIYSGDTLHKKAAITYKLRSGDEVSGITITIPVDAYHRLRGTVAAKDGRVINWANLTLTDTADDSITFKAKANREGVFSFPNVPAGTYTLAASNAYIVVTQESGDNNMPVQYRPTNTFADGSMGVLVKDADVLDVAVTLTEVPMPAQTQGTPSGQPGPQ